MLSFVTATKEGEYQVGEKRKSIIGRMMIYLLIIAFFACVLFIYYTKFFSETRENIINNGRINAIESTDRIDKSLAASMDIINLSAYTIDNMLRENRSSEDILDYLENETVAIQGSILTETTGLYGYINGIYMDGAGWVPDEGYEPTERPWYIDGMAGEGDIVIVDPYVDQETGTVMITIVRKLCDDKSVVAIDFTMGDLQRIVEEQVTDGASSEEFIVSSKGIIIAHSDPAQIGTDYFNSEDYVSMSVTKEIRKGNTGNLYLEDENRNYMVYYMPLYNGWTCVSVIDATEDFNKLRNPLVLTIIIAAVMITTFLMLVYQSAKKDAEIRKSEIMTERALAASEAKTSFLSNMSHEIRTPINAILGMNEMILRESDDSSILSYADNIRNAGTTLLGLINDILDFSKIEAGKIDIIPVDYDINSMANDLVTMIHNRADAKGLQMYLDFDPETPRYLNGDEVRIKQIITNILSNAVKYTEKGSVTFHIGFKKIENEPDKVLLHISIKDTGIGIKEEDKAKLFSKFERIEEKRNRNVEGTGLGMNITQSLLELMGSSLDVASTYGVGSIFSFELVQGVVKWEAMGNYEASYRSNNIKRKDFCVRFTAPEATILVVDDNPLNITVFKGLIKKNLVVTDTATSGDECIRYSQSKKYDAIFLDHLMPGKDGIETLKELKAQSGNPNLDTPVVCLTANALSGARDTYMDAGFDDYLTKPIDFNKLEEMLMRFIPDSKILPPDAETGEALKNAVPETKEPETAASGEESCDNSSFGKLSILDGKRVDVKQGIINSGDQDMYIPVLKVFYDSIVSTADGLDELYHSENYKEYTIKVHALKSSAKIIGAMPLGEEAQKLENAGKAGDAEYIKGHHDAFIKEYRSFYEMISPIFADEKKGVSRAEADEDLMKDVYAELYNAADKMDTEMLECVFEDMDGYGIPAEDMALFDELKDAADMYDYERICSLLQQKV